MDRHKTKAYKLQRRHRRVRKQVFGTGERPRLCVHRSLKNLQVQVVNDFDGQTLVAASTLEPSLKEAIGYGGNKQAATKLGEVVAARCQEKGIDQVVFDRGGYKFHGRVKALAEAARKGGLKF